jgi:hypothetical protein
VLDKLGRWARRWGVRFSSSKSAVVWFRARGPTAQAIYTNDILSLPAHQIAYNADTKIELPITDRYQYLGIWLDARFSSQPHFAHMKAKCQSVSAMLNSVQSPDAPPGFDVIRALVQAILIPRITYGLPFVNLTERQNAQINALMYKPILRVLALPMSVHRAGLAVYTDLPVVQLLHPLSTAQLVLSTLKQVNDAEVRSNLSAYPVFQLIWNACNKDATLARAAMLGEASRSFINRHFDSRSILDRFHSSMIMWDLAHLLPEAAILTDPRPAFWTANRFREALLDATRSLSCERMLLESRGHSVIHRGIAATAPRLAQNDPLGCELPPQFGVPSSLSDVDELQQLARDRSYFPLGPAPSLEFDSISHAKLRSRVALNRSAFHGVRNARSSDPFAPRYCPRCARFPPLVETAHHVITECPTFAVQRRMLRARLDNAIVAIRERARQHQRWGAIVRNDADALYHCVLASPFIFELLDSHDRDACLDLLQATGEFLERIRLVRPV